MSELASRACQDCGGQSFDLHGRQNEEAPVVDDVLQIARLLFGVPSNPPVARRDLPCGTGPVVSLASAQEVRSVDWICWASGLIVYSPTQFVPSNGMKYTARVP